MSFTPVYVKISEDGDPMICPRCNSVVQDGTKFCIYCGMPLMNVQPQTAPFAADETVAAPRKEVFAEQDKPFLAPEEEAVAAPSPVPDNSAQDIPFVSPEEGTVVIPVEPVNSYVPPLEPVNNYVPPVEPAAPPVQPVIEEKAPKKKSGIILPIILGVLLLGAIALAVIMAIQKSNAEEELAYVESELEDAQNELDLINADDEYYSQLDEYAYGFEEIADFARQSNCGYASELFHVNQGIVILDPDDTRKTITLTAAFDEGVEISVDIYGYGADLNFSEDSWSGDTTTLYVDRDADDMEEGEVGITTVTFTNDLNSQTFDILIITLG